MSATNNDPLNPATSEGDPPSSPLDGRLRADAQADAIAEVVASVWREVDLALRPIVGQRGVVALFNRSVHLAAQTHLWLAPGRHDPDLPLDPAPLAALFAQQSAAQALAGGKHLLVTFHQLLASLIGASLTERLLRTAWGPPLHGNSLQDPSS